MAEELAEKVKLLSSNWRAYEMAASARDYETMNMLNREHRDICRWLAENGMPFGSLAYNQETLTFSLPAPIMAAVSQ